MFAVAGLFMPAGDLGLRHDVQLLADYGVIKSTLTSWPMSWDTLAADLATVENMEQLPGKRVANDVLPAVTGDGQYAGGNGSTRGLLDRIRKPGS